MTDKERKEYLERVGSYTCPIPQYDEMQRRLQNWFDRNGKGNKDSKSKKETR